MGEAIRSQTGGRIGAFVQSAAYRRAVEYHRAAVLELLFVVAAFAWGIALVWAMLADSAPLPAKPRKLRKTCRSCRYDLRGAPFTPRCPECGSEHPQW